MAAKPKLTDFLKKLCTDKNAIKAFKKDPMKAMKNAGLTAAQIEIVQGGDPQKLSDAVIAEHIDPKATTAIIFVIGTGLVYFSEE